MRVETLGVHLRTRTKQLAAKEKTRRKKRGVRFSLIRKNLVFQRILYEDWCEEVVEDGSGPREEGKLLASRLQKDCN